jgi:uncharacterized paraquat-inducible protein A
MTIACADCGTLQDLPRLPWGAIAVCPTCARLDATLASLERTSLADYLDEHPAAVLRGRPRRGD